MDADVLYGDILCLFNADTDTALNVEGFCEQGAYPLSFRRAQTAFLDWSGAMFVVEPRSPCCSREEFRSFVSDNVLSLFVDAQQQQDARVVEMREQAAVRKNQMVQRVSFEVESAASNYEMHKGSAVKYGDVVQLRHVNSGRYLCIRTCANSAATEFAVVDSVEAVETSHWKFHSSTRQGGTLKYAVESQLVSVVYDAMMAVAVGPSGPTAFKMTTNIDACSTFKVVRIGTDKYSAKCLCAGDSVVISHFSSGAVLTSRYGDYFTFLQVEKQANVSDDVRFLLIPARACFVVEGRDILEPIQWKASTRDALRLRCLCSGEIMALTSHTGPENETEDMFSDDSIKPLVACTIQASPTIAEDTAFHLIGIDDHASVADSCFQIVHAASNTNLAMNSRRGLSILAPNFGENGNNTFFRCGLADSRAVVECRRLASYKSAFEYLIALIGLEVTMSSEFVSVATQHFEDLTRWLGDASPQLRLWRQEGLYDNGCVDLLRTLLGAPMEICKMPLSAIVKQQRYRHVCTFIGSCGTCIEAVVTDCAQNGALFLSWIEFLIEVMMCFDSIAKVILACFMCSKGAMRVVKKQHIHTIIELSSGTSKTRFFHSLSQLLLAGGDDSIRCQEFVLSKLFPSIAEKEATGAVRAVVPLARAEGKNVIILDITSDRVPQPLFNVINSPALFSSFCGFLELSDALCYNYCSRAIKELLAIEIMPYKVGLIILNDAIAPYILKTRVLQLMHRLYLLTPSSKGVDVSNVQLLIPWNIDSNEVSYSISNMYPDQSHWESTIELQDIVLHTIENNDSLGFHSDKDAYTAVALSTAVTFCLGGLFCMPIETVTKNAGPYFRSRAKAFLRSKTAERAKSLGVSIDDLALMGSVSCQLFQLELLLQPLQMLLDTSTDQIKHTTLQGVMSCKNEAMRCLAVILGIRRHFEVLQTLKRFKEDIVSSKISKNVDMLSFTPSATASPPLALQLIGINMASLPITLTNFFCHPQNTNCLATIDLIVRIFLDHVDFSNVALRILLMSDPLITSSYRAVKDLISLMTQDLNSAVDHLHHSDKHASGDVTSGSEVSSVRLNDISNYAQAADFTLRFSQLADLFVRPILSCTSSEILSKIHLVGRILGLQDVVLNALNTILSACAPVEMHEASRLTPRLRKVTPRPATVSSRFSGDLHKKLVDSTCQIVAHMCRHHPIAQKFFFEHIDVFIRFLQFGREENDVRAVFSAIGAILEGNRDACFQSQDTLVPDLIILLLRKGKWPSVLVLLRKCVTFVDGSSKSIIQKLIMTSFARNHVILIQLPFADNAVFSHRSLKKMEMSVEYTIECMRLLAAICKDSPQNQSSVRSWIPIADVPSVIRSNLKHPETVVNFIEVVVAAYLVPSFDAASERQHVNSIIEVLNGIIDLYCSVNGIKVIGPDSETDSASLTSKPILNDSHVALNIVSPSVASIPSTLLDAAVLFYISMYKSNQAMASYSLSVSHVSSRLISIVCSRVCSVSQKSSIKTLLDHFFSSRILPSSVSKLYSSLPGTFESAVENEPLFTNSDDSAASLWPYFLNQEYGAYLKDEKSCVSSLVKHFQEATFLNPDLDFEKHLIWSIQQASLADDTRTVLIRVTHSIWKSGKRNWQMSHIRVVFSIMCDLLIASSKTEKPSEVCLASVFFCIDMLSCSDSGKLYQGEFFEVMKAYGSVAIASIHYIIDVAVYYAEEYSRLLSSTKDSTVIQFNSSDPQQSHLAFCEKMFMLLKSFCEGHFSDGQLLLGQSLGSSNVINLSTQLLCALSGARSQLAESLQMASLDFLVESIQGPCLANCETALNSRIVAAFNLYMRAEPYSFESPVMPSEISMARIEKFCVFFQALLEETRADTRVKPLFNAAASFILMNTDFSHLLAFVENACSILTSVKGKMVSSQRLRNLCCSIFVLLTYLGATQTDRPHVLEPFCSGFHVKNPRGRPQAAVARWEDFIAEFWAGIVSIEISRDKTLCKVYFYSRRSLSTQRDSKRVSSSLDWSNEHPQGRLISFLKNIDQMRYELNHMSRISTKPFLTLLMSMHGFFFYGRFVSVLFINLLLLIFYQYKIPESHGDAPGGFLGELVTPSDLVEFARGPVVIFNMICYVYLLFHLIIIDGLPIIRARLRSTLHIDSVEMRKLLFRDCSLSLGLDFKGPFHIMQCIFALFGHVRFFILGCYCVLSLYLVSDFLNPFSTVAMSFFLLELISHSSLVEMAIMSVTNRWRLLCQVSIGTIVFIYWCACVIYIYFFRDLEFSVSRVVDGNSPPFYENEYYVAPRYLWKCFVFVLDNSLRTQDIGKAFGIVQSSMVDDILLKMPVARIFIRITISFLFWFVFQLIFLRVFPGVISDTFKANRIKEQHIKASRSTKCFICGLESHVFTLTGTTFDSHLRKEHAPFNYMRYFIYLAEKDPNEYTGLESYVIDCILSYNCEFLPIGTCLSIQASAVSDIDNDGPAMAGLRSIPAKYFSTRLAAISKRQKEIDADVDHLNGARTAVQSIGITEIRRQHQQKLEILKACPYINQ